MTNFLAAFLGRSGLVLSAPTADGTAGQAMVTDGAKVLSFAGPFAPLTGAGTSGTWDISITGSAAVATVALNAALLDGLDSTAFALAGHVHSAADITSGTLPLARGGTNATTAAGARVSLLPAMAGNTLKVLRVNAGETDAEWATISIPIGANPTASVGLAAVNGVAATFLRSDGAPALSQAIVPTWTGVHVFSPVGGTPIKVIPPTSVLMQFARAGSNVFEFQQGTTAAIFLLYDATADTIYWQTSNGDLLLHPSATGVVSVGMIPSGADLLQVGGNVLLSSTSPTLKLTDTTALAKSLTITVDANAVNIRESAGAAGSLIVLDLASNLVGIGCAPTGAKLEVCHDGAVLALTSVLAGSRESYIEFRSFTGAGRGYFGYGAASEEFFLASFGNAKMNFYVNGGYRLAVGPAGGVSIGTGYVATDPGAENFIVEGNSGFGTTSTTERVNVAGTVKCDALNSPVTHGAINAATDGATVTFDLDVANKHHVTLGGNRTLALSNENNGQGFLIILKQDGTGSRTVTWWSGILWAGGTVPVLTTTANKYDIFSFLRVSPGVYLGMVVKNF